jgi:hypothetical protein
MADVSATTGVVWEDSTPFLMARIEGTDGDLITQADVSSIAYTSVDMHGDTTSAVSSGALVVAATVFDTLQTDSRWTVDSTGYNFGFLLPAACIPEGDRCYSIDVVLTMASGGSIPVVWKLTTKKRYKGS